MEEDEIRSGAEPGPPLWQVVLVFLLLVLFYYLDPVGFSLALHRICHS